MKRYSFWLAALLPLFSIAQDVKPKGTRWQYTGSVAGGLIIGAQQPSYLFQTIQGVKKRRWMAGIGTGLDYYFIRSVPVVAHGEFAVRPIKKMNTYVYGQAGPAIPWRNDPFREKWQNQDIYSFTMGWLAEAGLGFRFPLGKNLQGFTAIGYSYKQANYTEMQVNWWGDPLRSFIPEIEPTYKTQQLHMLRANIRFGISW